MKLLLGLLISAAMFLFVLGMISPKHGLFWLDGSRTRWKVAGFYVASLVVLATWGSFFDSEKTPSPAKVAPQLTEREKLFLRDSIELDSVLKSVAQKTAEIEKHFSPYDGSHRRLEDAIKAMMNNPDSYEHVETRWTRSELEGEIIVHCKFRGANAFNAIMLNRIKARCDAKTGDVIEIMQE